MVFSYIAMDSEGKEKRGKVEADGQTEALSKVRGLGLFPVNMSESAGEEAQEPQQAHEDEGANDGRPPSGGDMSEAFGMMADACGTMMVGLLRNGFARSEAVELVKVFLAKMLESGGAGSARTSEGKA